VHDVYEVLDIRYLLCLVPNKTRTICDWSDTCCAIIFASVGFYLQEVNIKPIEG